MQYLRPIYVHVNSGRTSSALPIDYYDEDSVTVDAIYKAIRLYGSKVKTEDIMKYGFIFTVNDEYKLGSFDKHIQKFKIGMKDYTNLLRRCHHGKEETETL